MNTASRKSTGTREMLLGLLNDIDLITKEMIESAISGVQGQKSAAFDQKQLTDLLIMKQEELRRGLEVASEQAIVEEKIGVVLLQVQKQQDEIRLLQTRLKDAEHVLATAIYQAKQKLASIQKANKRPINSEDLIKYAHRISCTNAVQAPLNWQQGDPRRPYPTDIEMRCGFLGRAGDMLQFPPGAPQGLGLDGLSGVKFPTPPQSMPTGLDVGPSSAAMALGSSYPWQSSDIHLAMGKGEQKSRENADDEYISSDSSSSSSSDSQ